ncbi:biotin-dependent carboxyltransferase family protein [Ornithinibacillus salinisoli]|uniref:Biotin-dependent carboxyltransferase family protein n=1 Tax=Ornithinibacillus salinisoli TaxID=1848459 RepID=A0ABW4W1L3_9BACI
MVSQALFRVNKPGLLTTYQDTGRIGYQRFGVPMSGAMDRFALQVANILVGNPRDEVCMEVALIGPQLVVLHPVTIAITGADLEAKLNGKLIPTWTAFRVEKGDHITFGRQHSGVYTYIAVAGGLECPSFFGSKSTDVKSGFGSSLEMDDTVYGFPIRTNAGIGLTKPAIPTYKKSIQVAVMEGPHTELFTTSEREAFYKNTHTLDANSNRMGYRLRTEHEIWENKSSIWSDAIPFGSIQVPPNGQPIILMADRQTTGGYPRIGTIISSDIPHVAQLVPRGKISFYSITIEEAQQRAINMENFLKNLELFRKFLQ